MRSAAQQDAAAIAERYLHAVAARDWAAGCDTRTRQDQRNQPGQAEPATTLAAVIDVDGRWRLEDVDESRTR